MNKYVLLRFVVLIILGTGILVIVQACSLDGESCLVNADCCSGICDVNCCNISCPVDDWYNISSNYSCCDEDKICTCQDQEYRDYYCNSGGDCVFNITNTTIIKSNCTTDCTEPICEGNVSYYRGYCLNGKCYYKGVLNCGSDFCGLFENNYCCDKNVCHSRTCYNSSCENGSCYSAPYTDIEIVENCIYSCEDGKCLSLGSMIKIDPLTANIALGSKDINLFKIRVSNNYNYTLNLTIRVIAGSYPLSVEWLNFSTGTSYCGIIEDCKETELIILNNTENTTIVNLEIAERMGSYEFEISIKDNVKGELYKAKSRLYIFSEAIGSESIFLLIFLFSVSVFMICKYTPSNLEK